MMCGPPPPIGRIPIPPPPPSRVTVSAPSGSIAVFSSSSGGNSNFGCPNLQDLPSGQNPARYIPHGTDRTCRFRQFGPCRQNPRAYHAQSFTRSSGFRCKNTHSGLAHLPKFTKKWHGGIFDRSYSCKNSHESPFLQRPRSQCLQTTARSPFVWR